MLKNCAVGMICRHKKTMTRCRILHRTEIMLVEVSEKSLGIPAVVYEEVCENGWPIVKGATRTRGISDFKLQFEESNTIGVVT